ncbi:hypothetical protein NUW58_g8726 [Xylaria curta]|uniref:Uncharacterized protein n=1 Tax=Xylaria curta TaxID=42375 RepID=A0ACC1N609_9PEZI|nr:hypothetical protein NUW58_g8726 [Xylaria curta]
MESLVHVLMVGRRFMKVFDSKPGIAEKVIQNQIHPLLLPLAVANMEASRKEYTHQDLDEVKKLYLDVLYNPSHFTDRLKGRPNWEHRFPIKDLIRMGRVYTLIKRLTRKFSSAAWSHLSPSGEPAKLSEAEEVRFYRAFYRLELFSKLCRGDSVIGDSFLHTRSCFFLLMHAPWERGQMACINHFWYAMCSKLVDTGEPRDYVGPFFEPVDAFRRRKFPDALLSQGVEFWVSMLEARNPRELATIWLTTTRKKSVRLSDMLALTCLADGYYSPWYTTGEDTRKYILPNTPYDDRDPGPVRMWVRCHGWSTNVFRTSIMIGREVFGRLAYLFWDEERCERENLYRLFGYWARLDPPNFTR